MITAAEYPNCTASEGEGGLPESCRVGTGESREKMDSVWDRGVGRLGDGGGERS